VVEPTKEKKTRRSNQISASAKTVLDEIAKLTPNITDNAVKLRTMYSVVRVLNYLEGLEQDNVSNKLIILMYHMFPLLEDNDLEVAISTMEEVYENLGKRSYETCTGCGKVYFREVRSVKRRTNNFCPSCRIKNRASKRLYMKRVRSKESC